MKGQERAYRITPFSTGNSSQDIFKSVPRMKIPRGLGNSRSHGANAFFVPCMWLTRATRTSRIEALYTLLASISNLFLNN